MGRVRSHLKPNGEIWGREVDYTVILETPVISALSWWEGGSS